VALTPADLLALSLRAASLVAALQAAGVVLFIRRHGRALDRAARSITTLAIASAVAGIALTVLQQLSEPARLAGSLGGILDPGLQRLSLTSAAGTAAAARIAGLLLCAAFALAAERFRFLAPLGVALIAISFALMGHTTTHEPRMALAALLVLHVGVVAFWFGALWPLHEIVTAEAYDTAGWVLDAFSRDATLLVPTILVAGIALAALLLPSMASLLHPFGLLLVAKTAGFATLLGLAALNKWRLAPRVSSGDARAAHTLRISLRVEWLLIAVILCVTTALTGLFAPHA
jgi:putative copper resistance protein D